MKRDMNITICTFQYIYIYYNLHKISPNINHVDGHLEQIMYLVTRINILHHSSWFLKRFLNRLFSISIKNCKVTQDFSV